MTNALKTRCRDVARTLVLMLGLGLGIVFGAAAATPSPVAQAAALYHNYCSVCHGDKGDGKSRATGSLSTLPRDFTSEASRRELTRERIVAAVAYGRPGTAMVAWRSQLSDADIARLADYVLAQFINPDINQAGQAPAPNAAISGTRAHGGREVDATSTPAQVDMKAGLPNGLKGDLKRGGAFYVANCATCHGARGDGVGPRAYFINPKPRNFVDATSRARFNRVALYAAVSEGRLGSEMPAWKQVATPQQMVDVSEYVFQSFIQGKAAAATTGAVR